jgi:hypothetical protein
VPKDIRAKKRNMIDLSQRQIVIRGLYLEHRQYLKGTMTMKSGRKDFGGKQ